MSSKREDRSTSVQTKPEEDKHFTPAEPGGDTPPPSAKRTENDGLPVFWAFAVLLTVALVVAGFNWAGRIPPTQIEIFSNIAMFAVAAKGFFAMGQPSTLSGRKLSSTLGNLTVSALAFFMNIKVFGCAIRWDHLLDDLWSWHIGWIICAIVQVLFLSGFAQYALRQTLQFSTMAARQVKRAACALVNAIKLSDKGVLLIFLTGAALWGAYLGSQIFGRGVQAAFSDAKILWGSVLLLLVWTVVGILLYVVPAVCKKSKWTVFGMNGKKIVITVGIAAAVMSAVLIFALLALLGGVRIVVTVLAALTVLAGLICAAVKYSVEKSLRLNSGRRERPNGGVSSQDSSVQDSPVQGSSVQDSPVQGSSVQDSPVQGSSVQDSSVQDSSVQNTQGQSAPGQGDLNQNTSDQSAPGQSDWNQSSPAICRKPYLRDVLVTILAYIVIPLVLACVMVVLSDEIRGLLTAGDYTWQQFMDAISGLLQCAGNGSQT